MPYLTPQNDAVATTCYSIVVPDDHEWRMVIQGHFEALLLQYNWEQFGLSRDYVVDRLRELNPNILGCDAMVDCQDVADCIETSFTVQQTINNYLEQSGTLDPNLGSETATIENRVTDPSTDTIADSPDPCDFDKLWAGIREMVERIDQEGRDMLEDLAVINDQVQQIQRFIEIVPIIGNLINSVVDFFTEQIPDILNAYNSFSSPSALDAVACDIFEMVCSECRYPTYDEILQYFGSHSMAGLPPLEASTMSQVWDIAKGLPIAVPTVTWYTVNALQVLTLGLGGTWVGNFGQRTFGIWCSFGEDNPNDNWSILCNACPDPPFELFIDFTTSSNVPPVNIFTGAWNSSEGAVQCGNVSSTKVVNIRFQMQGSMIASEGAYEYSCVGEEGLNNQITMGGVQRIPAYPATHEQVETGEFPSPTALPTVSATATTNRISQPSSQIYVYNVTIRGNGYVEPDWQPFKVYGVDA